MVFSDGTRLLCITGTICAAGGQRCNAVAPTFFALVPPTITATLAYHSNAYVSGLTQLSRLNPTLDNIRDLS